MPSALYVAVSLPLLRLWCIISDALSGFEDSSALLKHELAYCLGQMKMQSALPVLESVLGDESEDPMVRHEVCDQNFDFSLFIHDALMRQAAEAMGAISASQSVPVLHKYLSDVERCVRETCEIAIAKIEWDHSEEGRRHLKTRNAEDAL
jgi:deoxyhypusine monooxygenase